MDNQAQQLARLAKLMDVSAGVLRDLLTVRDVDRETDNLKRVADELERLATQIKRVGFSELPL